MGIMGGCVRGSPDSQRTETGSGPHPDSHPDSVLPADSTTESTAESARESAAESNRDTGVIDGPLIVSWGDLHGHSGLSFDGCEDPTALCMPADLTPGAHFFENAATNGLAFAALTDHAEYSRIQVPTEGTDLSIWDTAKALVAAADGGPVVPILGFEWTAGHTSGHRTVLLEDPASCEAYRIPGPAPTDGGSRAGGQVTFLANPLPAVTDAATFAAEVDAAGSGSGCVPTRWLSFLHHVAYYPPAAVDWSQSSYSLATDTVVEMASEHGSSECADPTAPGCDWRVQTDFYQPAGAVQVALQLDHELGFVGGTDRHDSDPGRLDIGGGPTGHLVDSDGDGVDDGPQYQFTSGTLTGVITPSPLTRAGIFDALEARHTYVASWLPTGLSVTATSAGLDYLPGDEVPAGALSVAVDLADPNVSDWSAEIVDATGAAVPTAGAETVLTPTAGQALYVRIDATVGGVAQRAWASPFFIR